MPDTPGQGSTEALREYLRQVPDEMEHRAGLPSDIQEELDALDAGPAEPAAAPEGVLGYLVARTGTPGPPSGVTPTTLMTLDEARREARIRGTGTGWAPVEVRAVNVTVELAAAREALRNVQAALYASNPASAMAIIEHAGIGGL